MFTEISLFDWNFDFHNSKKELGGGTVLDIGVYVIQLCQFVFRKRPTLIKATGVLNSDGVDSEMQAELHYGDGKFAKITTTALKVVPKTAVIRGTKGELTVSFIFIQKT